MSRNEESYESLEEIIAVLKESQFPKLVWAAKNYSKASLIKDLEDINNRQEKQNEKI